MGKRGNFMKINNKTTKIPEDFDNPAKASDFWDNNSVADHWDKTTEVKFDVDIKKEARYVVLEKELSKMVAKISRQRGVSPETLVNLWIREKVHAK
jgi:hypothetical protein